MRKSPTTIGALAVAGIAIVAGGSAFTASNTGMVASDKLGYGATTVTGATVNSLDYNFNTAKSEITSVTLVLAGDTTASAVSLGYNDAAPVTCGTGTFATSATTYTCTNGGASQSVSGLSKTAVFLT